MTIAACIPCYNNASSLQLVTESLTAQTNTLDRIFAVDDASTDHSRDIACAMGLQFIALKRNDGRGAVRATAIEKCQDEFLLSCDATNALDSRFLEYAIPWFDDTHVAAVYARLIDPNPTGTIGRWRARHLFKQGCEMRVNENASLCTWAYVSRVAAIRAVGNFRSDLRHSEDVELGDRLLKAGYKVVFEPKCIAHPLVRNTIAQCLERHWRWYVARHGRMTLTDLCRWAGLAWRSMLVEDMRAKDPAAAVISLILPFHHWWRSQREKANRKIHT